MLTREEADALAAVMPDAQIYEDDFEFYIATARMFAQVGETRWEVHFTQLAITVAPQEPELDLTPYWQALVKGYVDLTLWDDAYATIMVVPHDLERRRMVRSLVHRMCEENAVEKLMSFNFVGITNDVEEALSFKARTSDPRSRPFYSRILYSWYVGKNDYRNGERRVH
jgi:nuclear pore complex protein Nup160